jgi:hypothetical protein
VQFAIVVTVMPMMFISIMFFVTVRMPMAVSVLFVAMTMIMACKRGVLPDAQKCCYAHNQNPFFTKHLVPLGEKY